MALPLLPSEFSLAPVSVILAEGREGRFLSRSACEAYWQILGMGIDAVMPEGGAQFGAFSERRSVITLADDEAVAKLEALVAENPEAIKLPKIPDWLIDLAISKLIEALFRRLDPAAS